LHHNLDELCPAIGRRRVGPIGARLLAPRLAKRSSLIRSNARDHLSELPRTTELIDGPATKYPTCALQLRGLNRRCPEQQTEAAFSLGFPVIQAAGRKYWLMFRRLRKSTQ